MNVSKALWISHTDEKGKRKGIFSLDLHPKFPILATGSMDSTIKVWKLPPQSEPTGSCIATLTRHSGAVLAVRWSPGNGKFLASGSDDRSIVIWAATTRNQAQRDGVGGEEEESSNTGSGGGEFASLKCCKVLAGFHASDVTDLQWTRECLVSCGVDNALCVFEGKTFSLLHRITLNSIAKGMAVDPLGQFLALQQEDCTILFRLQDWGQERCISWVSSSETLVARPSFTPDGSVLGCCNDGKGAWMIHRDTWLSDAGFVGHLGPVECVKFCPLTWKPNKEEEERDQEQEMHSSEGSFSVAAVGSQDGSISLWSNEDSRPLAVIWGLFSHGCLDIAWSCSSSSECCFFACSFDGSVVQVQLDGERIFGMAGGAFVDLSSQRLGEEPNGGIEARKSKPNALIVDLPESVVQMQLEEAAREIVPEKYQRGVKVSDKSGISNLRSASNASAISNASTVSNASASTSSISTSNAISLSTAPSISLSLNDSKEQNLPSSSASAIPPTDELISQSSKIVLQDSLHTLKTQRVESLSSGKRRITPLFIKALDGGGIEDENEQQTAQGQQNSSFSSLPPPIKRALFLDSTLTKVLISSSQKGNEVSIAGNSVGKQPTLSGMIGKVTNGKNCSVNVPLSSQRNAYLTISLQSLGTSSQKLCIQSKASLLWSSTFHASATASSSNDSMNSSSVCSSPSPSGLIHNFIYDSKYLILVFQELSQVAVRSLRTGRLLFPNVDLGFPLHYACILSLGSQSSEMLPPLENAHENASIAVFVGIEGSVAAWNLTKRKSIMRSTLPFGFFAPVSTQQSSNDESSLAICLVSIKASSPQLLEFTFSSGKSFCYNLTLGVWTPVKQGLVTGVEKDKECMSVEASSSSPWALCTPEEKATLQAMQTSELEERMAGCLMEGRFDLYLSFALPYLKSICALRNGMGKLEEFLSELSDLLLLFLVNGDSNDAVSCALMVQGIKDCLAIPMAYGLCKDRVEELFIVLGNRLGLGTTQAKR